MSRAYLPCFAVSMSEAFRADPADLSDAKGSAATIAVDFAGVGSAAATTRRILHIFAKSVYTKVVAPAMLIAETLADADGYTRSQVADRFIRAIGVLSALGDLTRAPQTGGPLRTVSMLVTLNGLAVRLPAGIVDRTVSGLRAVP
jgi:hypothetical protein